MLSSRASSQNPRADSSIDPELQRLVLKQNLLLEIELQRSYLNPNGLKRLLTVQNSLGKIQDTINTALKSDLQRLRKYNRRIFILRKRGILSWNFKSFNSYLSTIFESIKANFKKLPTTSIIWSLKYKKNIQGEPTLLHSVLNFCNNFSLRVCICCIYCLSFFTLFLVWY